MTNDVAVVSDKLTCSEVRGLPSVVCRGGHPNWKTQTGDALKIYKKKMVSKVSNLEISGLLKEQK